MLKINVSVLLWIIILGMFASCSKDSSSLQLPSTLVWEIEHNVIEPSGGSENIWSGFEIKKNYFVTDKTIAKFILWRKSQEKKILSLRYLLRGLPVKVFVNRKKAFQLKPDYEAGKASYRIKLLKGFNFIEFRLSGKTDLRIKKLQIGGPVKERAYDIVQGEAFSRFHPAGTGKIRLKGHGKVEFRVVEYKQGHAVSRNEELETGFLSPAIKFSFNMESLGFLRLLVKSGEFDIKEYTFSESPQRSQGLSQEKSIKNIIIKEKPGIHIFLIDGCHAEHLGVYGYYRNTSPHINDFSQDGVIFDNAYANATFTRSSVASIFTGFHPHRHKLRVLTNVLPKGLVMLPEFMQKSGYKTAIFTEAGNISERFGFAQGVDRYRKVFHHWDDPRYLENNMFKFFCQWLENPGLLFTYVHVRAPHFPIIPPPPYLDMFKQKASINDLQQKREVNSNDKRLLWGGNAKRYGKSKNSLGNRKTKRLIMQLKKLGKEGHVFTSEEIKEVTDDYDSCIRYVDAQVGELLDKLKQEGRYDSSLIIFTSDHGEALYEHGMWGHGQNVYPETSRVPLIVKFPKQMELKGRVHRVTQLVDIFPTIAGLFGKERFFDGESLLRSIRKKEMDDRFGYSTTFGSPPCIGIRWRSWYYIIHMYNNEEELFNLEVDPLQNLAGLEENRELLMFFKTKFLDWYVDFDNIERTSQSMDLKKLPKGELDNLKSLGYID